MGIELSSRGKKGCKKIKQIVIVGCCIKMFQHKEGEGGLVAKHVLRLFWFHEMHTTKIAKHVQRVLKDHFVLMGTRQGMQESKACCLMIFFFIKGNYIEKTSSGDQGLQEVNCLNG